MGSNQEKKNNANNGMISLKVPLIISLCTNLVLLICVVVLAVLLATTSLTAATVATQSSDSGTTSTTTESTSTEDEEEEETIYSFTDYDDNTVEVYAYNAYITGEYICAGDATNWVFDYDSDTGVTSVAVSESDGTELGTYVVYFYLTTDGTTLVCNILDEEDESISLIYYLMTVLDDEDNSEAIGLYFVSATEEDSGFLLYTPDYYNAHVNEDGTFDFAVSEDETEETEASDD